MVKTYKVQYDEAGTLKFVGKDNGTIFKGTDDESSISVFKNTFTTMVITRYICVHPLTWVRGIALWMELYGCKRGFLRIIARLFPKQTTYL
ncbi:predicted protein [Nematostella vectensis]|uniref:F5/8 type C domain-containing protein n=1 Tax=Nematostella vectensis TaxID=45351 RepID=A7S9Y0_NEMVE|nr:predicted protein [Nematostella vectensis]|eukprot:XP_001631567.1 predicted protein [Nematostella vectensis]